MHNLTFKERKLISINNLPFEENVQGFFDRWWVDGVINLYQCSFSNAYETDFYFSVLLQENGDEVARIWLTERHINAEFENLILPEKIMEIYMFEVNEKYRRQGIGLQVINMLIQKYPSKTFLAFSEQADYFWEKTPLKHYSRADAIDTGPQQTVRRGFIYIP